MLIGGGGYDHYVIARGQGHDTLINWIGEARGALHIDNESRESLWFQRAGNDLRVQLLGSDTDITVQGWYDNSVSRLNRIALGGSHTDYLLGTHVDQLVQAMAGFSGSHPGFDPKAPAVISDATAYAVRLAQGKNAEALKELQAIKDWSLAGPSTYDLMISYHLKRGDGQAALAMIDKAERNLGSEELFITEKLLANQQLKNTQQVQTVLRKCEQYPTRKENCKKLAPIKA